jgi:hypothetical protein
MAREIVAKGKSDERGDKRINLLIVEERKRGQITMADRAHKVMNGKPSNEAAPGTRALLRNPSILT